MKINGQGVVGTRCALQKLDLALPREQVVMNKKKILIVDDSLIVLKAFSTKLKAAGYEVETAADGSEALEKAAESHPDLVIMDINFPPDISQGGVAWDGFRIIEWMRHTGSAGLAPTIIITSDEPEKHRLKALKAGAVAVFQKPISLAVLLKTLEECFQNSGVSCVR